MTLSHLAHVVRLKTPQQEETENSREKDPSKDNKRKRKHGRFRLGYSIYTPLQPPNTRTKGKKGKGNEREEKGSDIKLAKPPPTGCRSRS